MDAPNPRDPRSARPFVLAAIAPGLALAVLVALASRVVHQQLPHAVAPVIGEVVIAVLLGLVIGNSLPLPESLAPGIRFSFHRVLRAAIILLGASFSVQQVAAIGGRAVALVAVLMTIALLAAHFLGRLAGVPSRLATLIGVGTAVCGNSAIVAVAPVIDARDDEVSFAIATNTLFGTLAVFFYPLIGHLFRFHDPVFGTWAGSAVNDTSQVVATGFAYSDGAGRIATAVKLTRNALMGPVIILMGLLHGHAREGVAGAPGAPGGLAMRIRQSIPLFVLGFLALAALQSLGLLRQLSLRAGRDLVADADFWAKVLILIALSGVGLSTRIATMRRTGLRPFYVGLIVATAASGVSLLWIHVVGPATGG